MFQFIRNVHLALGLVCVVMAFIFALSSLVIIYRPWFPESVEQSERTIQVPPASASTPRALARALMRSEGLKGTVSGIEKDAEAIRFRIFRPGTEVRIEYGRSTGEARIELRRWGLAETLVQLHVNHGFRHGIRSDKRLGGLFSARLRGASSVSATGIYLWFAHYEERVVGGVLLAVGLTYGLVTLALTRLS